jgi:hypothetical protein
MADPLMTLGYLDLSTRVGRWGPAFLAAYRGSIKSSAQLAALYKQPAEFWIDEEAPSLIGRQFRKDGRLGDYGDYFRAAFSSPDEFNQSLEERPHLFVALAPTVAANLRDAGQSEAAAAILGRAEAIVAPWVRRQAPDPDLACAVSMLRAVEGKDEEAMRLLRAAVSRGWLPDGGMVAWDIAEEPAYARLLNRADFQALRRQVFARQADERRRAGPIGAIYAALGQKQAA